MLTSVKGMSPMKPRTCQWVSLFSQPTKSVKHTDADSFGSATPMHHDRPHTDEKNSHWYIGQDDRVRMFWPAGLKFYADTVKHRHQNWFITVVYDDKESKRRYFKSEIGRNETTTDSISASNAQSDSVDVDIKTVKAIKPIKAMEMAGYFGNKSFLKQQA